VSITPILVQRDYAAQTARAWLGGVAAPAINSAHLLLVLLLMY
jgi:hypothetical protein